MSISLDDVTKCGRSTIITSVGLGVLLFQAAQVRRRELGRAVGDLLRPVTAQADDTSHEKSEPSA
jgi:hypothetical protein